MLSQKLILKTLLGIFFVGGFSCGLVWSETKEFVYDDHAKRDPFLRLVGNNGLTLTFDTDLLVSDMVLEGVLLDRSHNSMAIINSIMIKEGDSVGLFTVKKIEASRVVLSKGEEEFVLQLKKEE